MLEKKQYSKPVEPVGQEIISIDFDDSSDYNYNDVVHCQYSKDGLGNSPSHTSHDLSATPSLCISEEGDGRGQRDNSCEDFDSLIDDEALMMLEEEGVAEWAGPVSDKGEVSEEVIQEEEEEEERDITDPGNMYMYIANNESVYYCNIIIYMCQYFMIVLKDIVHVYVCVCRLPST